MNKQYLGTCAKYSKGTNNHPWINQEKVWLCSKHYKEWLVIKEKHYQNSVTEFWLEIELEKPKTYEI